ncbi:MAG: hypothetical protein DMG40_19605 [Acidobacteria bacterium]|nr:MAG: hypothetical protein DMG40_19605 [Acidobacteriota bacterium]
MSGPQSRGVDHLGNISLVYGHSPAIERVNAMVPEIARTDIPVLLIGESGTGKEVYGRLIHRLSQRGHMPLKKLSCRALERSELHAQLRCDSKSGAEGPEEDLRTLFLDGIDELDLTCQKVLLSVLPDGDNGHSAARLIASSTRDLEKETESGRFRRELYFRINGVCLRLPSLRDRAEDVLPLMAHFLRKYAADLGREVPVLSDKEMEFLEMHGWPGNIRELENLARRIVLLGDSHRAIEELRALPALVLAEANEPRAIPLKVAARAASRQTERELISKALEGTHWNRKRAARQLQISYKSLLYKIKQTGLEEEHKGSKSAVDSSQETPRLCIRDSSN